MDELQAYIVLGFKHISDVKGYDHILFIITLCAIYRPAEWKKILILITAFTIGHSVTLALAALHVFPVNSYWIELLIPVTILSTSLLNILSKEDRYAPFVHYLLALGFGLIHGMGFSNFFNAISMDGRIVKPLLGFNIGLELGQLCIVGIFFLLYVLIFQCIHFKQSDWKLFFSGGGAITSLILITERV